MRRHTRILIVESNPFVALHLQRTVHGLGYEAPVVVPTGEDAVQLVDTTRFSLMLVELDLSGGIDGKETVEKIRSRHDIPVIFMTCDSERSLLETVLGAHSHACLLKPVRKETLQIAMDRMLRKARVRQGFHEKAVAGFSLMTRAGNASYPTAIGTAGMEPLIYLREDKQSPGSLEALGYSLDGFWEEKQHPDSGAYLEAHFAVGASSRHHAPAGRSITGGNGSRARKETKKAIECTGLNEICRAADGSPYKVPRLKIRLTTEQAR